MCSGIHEWRTVPESVALPPHNARAVLCADYVARLEYDLIRSSGDPDRPAKVLAETPIAYGGGE